MEAHLLEIYPGRPDPTCQMPLSVGTSFWYFVTCRNLSLGMINIKKIKFRLQNFVFYYDVLGLSCCLHLFLHFLLEKQNEPQYPNQSSLHFISIFQNNFRSLEAAQV